MGISTANINVGATSVASTGGTASSFTSLGDSIDRNEVFFDSTSIVDRKTCSFSTSQPKINASSPDGYTQGRSKFTLRYPIVLADGVTWTTCTFKAELATSVEMSTAEMDDMRYLSAQILADSDFDSFFNSLSVA